LQEDPLSQAYEQNLHLPQILFLSGCPHLMLCAFRYIVSTISHFRINDA
jgi:hypothetical protein